MSFQQQSPDTSHDEELAKAMQMEYDKQSVLAAATRTTPPPPPPAAAGATRGFGTYVEMPPEEMDDGSVPRTRGGSSMVTINFAPQLEISEDETRDASQASRPVVNPELLFEKMAYLVKTISFAGAFYWVYSVLFRAWWFVLTLGAVFCPVGYLGVKGTNIKYIFAFFIYLAVDSVFQLAFPFIYGYDFTLAGVVVSLVLAVMECMAAYYTYKFCEMIKLRANGASLDAMSDIL